MYVVQYLTETGTPSDNEFIGSYNTMEKAKKAKQLYIEDQIGKLTDVEKEPDFDLTEYNENLEYLERTVCIDKVVNRF